MFDWHTLHLASRRLLLVADDNNIPKLRMRRTCSRCHTCLTADCLAVRRHEPKRCCSAVWRTGITRAFPLARCLQTRGASLKVVYVPTRLPFLGPPLPLLLRSPFPPSCLGRLHLRLRGLLTPVSRRIMWARSKLVGEIEDARFRNAALRASHVGTRTGNGAWLS